MKTTATQDLRRIFKATQVE